MPVTLDPSELATDCNLYTNGAPDTDVAGQIVAVGQDEAVAEAKRILGTSRYDDLAALGATDADYRDLRRAVGRLAYFYAMPLLNLRLTAKGGFVRATGAVENTRDLMSAGELSAYRTALYRRGETLLSTLQESDARKPYGSAPAGGNTVYTL